MRRILVTVFLLGALAAIAAVAGGLWWVYQPMRTPAQTTDLSIDPGTLPRGVAQAVAEIGRAHV